MTVPEITRDDLLARLDALRDGARVPALAFDADGTLWSGDVGEELFEHAVASGWLREEARGALTQLAAEHGVDAANDANALGERLFGAHRSGVVGDVPAFEMMTWAYAGWDLAELEERTVTAIRELGFGDRAQPEVAAALGWARAHEVRVAIVSASPAFAVRAALRVTGLDADGVAGGQAALERGVVQPRMSQPLPYGPTKPVAAQALFPDATWLAAFGDSPYDFDLLCSALIGVLVRPKAALVQKAIAHRIPPSSPFALCTLRRET
jgi:phosphatidylglycerophosphatase C